MASFSALGTGDLAMSLMLALSAYFTFFSYFTALTIVLGSTVGLVFAMYVSKRYKIALPAIPPLFAFSSIALAIDLIIERMGNAQLYALLFGASALILALIYVTAKRQSGHVGTKISRPSSF